VIGRPVVAMIAVTVTIAGTFLTIFGASLTLCYPCGGFYGSESSVCEANPNAVVGCSPQQNFVLPFQPGMTCTIACTLQWNYALNITGFFVFAFGLGLYYLQRQSSNSGGVTSLPAKTSVMKLQPASG